MRGLIIFPFGTSPRMRGKRVRFPCRSNHRRNIPAYAGKTKWPPQQRKQRPEHPRVCGENLHQIIGIIKPIGTSPRMRGKRVLRSTQHEPHRNIPAYAGKTIRGNNFINLRQEHPRVCGENRYRQIREMPKLGTSPRMRGKRQPRLVLVTRRRNIPAYAGKTARGCPFYRHRPEHPRVCGENGCARSGNPRI